MSRFPQRWRTQRNAIRNANCKTSWIIKILNAHCASGKCPVAYLSECPRTPLSMSWPFQYVYVYVYVCVIITWHDMTYWVILWHCWILPSQRIAAQRSPPSTSNVECWASWAELCLGKVCDGVVTRWIWQLATTSRWALQLSLVEAPPRASV